MLCQSALILKCMDLGQFHIQIESQYNIAEMHLTVKFTQTKVDLSISFL